MTDFEEAVLDAMDWKAKCRKLEAELAVLKADNENVIVRRELLCRTIRALDTGDADPTQEESELSALLGGE